MDINNYLEIGKKELSSGLESFFYYNFRKLTDEDKFEIVRKLEFEAKNIMIVGIMTMGYEIAKILGSHRVVAYNPKDGWIESFVGKYVIFDDVITTFGTIRKCIMEIGRLPEKVICIVNRMKVVELGRNEI